MSSLGDAIARYDQSKQAYENKAGAYLRNRNLTLSAQNPGGIQVRTASAPTVTSVTAPKVTIGAANPAAFPARWVSGNPLQQFKNGFEQLGIRIAGTPQQKAQLREYQKERQNGQLNKITEQQFVNSPAGAAIMNTADSATLGLVGPTISRLTGNGNKYSQMLSQSQKSNPLVSLAGQLTGYILPSEIAEKGVSLVARPLLDMLGPSAAADIARPAITSAISQAGVSALSDAFSGKKPQAIAKDAALNAAVGGLLGGVGKTMEKASDIRNAMQVSGIKGMFAPAAEPASERTVAIASGLKAEKGNPADMFRPKGVVPAGAEPEADNAVTLANGLKAEKGSPAALLGSIKEAEPVSTSPRPGIDPARGVAAENSTDSIVPLITKNTSASAMKATPLTRQDAAEYLKTGKRLHVRNQKAEMLGLGDNPILSDQQKVDEFVNRSIAGQTTGTTKVYGKVGPQMAEDIRRASNGRIDVDGDYLELNSDWLKHMKTGHGVETDPEQISLTDDQIRKIPQYIANYDDILQTAVRPDGSKRITFGKKINGHSIIVNVVSSDRSSLTPITAYVLDTDKYNRLYGKIMDAGSREATAEMNPATLSTPEASRIPFASNNSITQFTKNTSEAAEKAGSGLVAPEKLLKTRDQITRLERARDNYDAKYLLTPDEKAMADDIAKGRRTVESLPSDARRETIAQAADNRKALNNSRQVLKDYNTARRKASDDQMQDLLKNSDNWKDKSKLAYGRETLDRNIEDIAPTSEEGNRLRETLVDPTHEHEAQRIRFENQGRQMARSLNLSKKESEVVQKVGEGVLEPAKMPVGMDRQKIMNAVGVLRKWYNDTFDAVNKKLVQYGYEPVKYRKDYFPHFDGHDELLDKIKSVFGIDLTNYDLPTEINGLTHNFKPGKQWFGNFLQRTGDKTTYDAVAGFDKYIDGVSRVLYHTDDIQRLRAFTRNIRYKYSDENLRKEYTKIIESDLPQADKDKKIEDLFEKGPTHLSNSVADLEDYIQVLAGKKSLSDRSIENTFGRKVYSVANNIEQRISRNMVAVNPSSWLTNFIPLTQATAGNDTGSVLRAMADTVKNVFGDDGFVGKSTFLTNRVGSNPLRKGIIEKATDIGAAPMRWIDEFTSQVITRAKYYDEIKRGVDAATAMKDADRWAARAIGDRSIGSQPTLFNSKNPITRLFTQFQLETNNQLSFLFKDLPKSLQGQATSKYASAVVKLALFSYLYNEGYQALTGRRLDIDPIGMGLGIYNDVSGERLPVQMDYWVKGNKMPKQTGAATLKNLDETVANNIPFIAAPAAALGIEDLGRLPISAAFPNVKNIYTAAASKDSGINKFWKIENEAEKPIAYGAFPVGGGQLKKTKDALLALRAGGDFAQTPSGKTLKYAVDKTPQNYLQAALFGKWSLPQAQDYINNGGLSAKRTQAWQDAVKQGADNGKAFAALKSLSEIQPAQGHKSVTTDQYIDALVYMKGLTDNQKIAVANTVLESETAREKFLKRLYQ